VEQEAENNTLVAVIQIKERRILSLAKASEEPLFVSDT